jgi:serine/threonine protein kinase
LVLAGRHRSLNRDVAIKVLSATSEEVSVRFATEAQILASMDHPHVVRVYDYIENNGLCLIVMELLAGGTLTRRRYDGVTAAGACAVALAVAEALTCAHGRGVLHRDIKPDNILFDADGLLKVTDFGIAKAFTGSVTMASAIVGTPKYMAPEQLTRGQLGPGTDLYALGVILYELLAGIPLFDPSLPPHTLYHHHLHVPPLPLPDTVPAEIAEVVLRTLKKDPAARYASARAFALALAHAASSSYGTGWVTRSGIPLRLDDEVRNTVERLPPPTAPPPDLPTDPSDAAPATASRPSTTRDSFPAPRSRIEGNNDPSVAARDAITSSAQLSGESHSAEIIDPVAELPTADPVERVSRDPAVRNNNVSRSQRRRFLAAAVLLFIAVGTTFIFISVQNRNPDKTGGHPSSPQTQSAPPPLQRVRDLILIDKSAYATKRVSPALTQLEASVQTATDLLAGMPDNAEFGVWLYARQLRSEQDWTELVPVGPLSDAYGSVTRRQQINAELARVNHVPEDRTGLYDTVLAAYRMMQHSYDPQSINSVLLFTDGTNDDPGGMSPGELLTILRNEYDPVRPVQITIVDFGDNINRDILDRITRITRGSVYVVHTQQDLKELQKVLPDAISRRVAR